MKRTLTAKLTLTTSAAALALGGAACDVEAGETGDEPLEEPLLDDGAEPEPAG